MAATAGLPVGASAPRAGPGAPVEAPRSLGPLHPDAVMDAPEQSGGIGRWLMLWGPLIIVGFLVLVFRGGTDRDGAGTDAAESPAPAAGSRTHLTGAEGSFPSVSGASTGAFRPAGVARGVPTGFDRSAPADESTMRTSWSGMPAITDRGFGAAVPAGTSRGGYPPPPGPYRNPWGRGSTAGGKIWSPDESAPPSWSPGGGDSTEGDARQTRWVQCAPPYFWCPAPDGPTW